MNPSTVYQGSRDQKSHFAGAVPQARVHHQPQSNYGFSANTGYQTRVTHAPVSHSPALNYGQPQVQVLQSVPVSRPVYTHTPSFISRFNPFTYFSSPSVVVADDYSVRRTWVHSPVSLLASSVSVAVLGITLFTFGLIVVDPILLLLGSILTVASGAFGLIKAMNN